MEDKNVVFPKVFRGYDTKAVNDYILSTDRAFEKESEELKGQIAVLSKTVDEKSDEIASLSEKLSLISDQVDKLNAELSERDIKIADLIRSLEQARYDLDQSKQRENESRSLLAQKDDEIALLESEVSLVKSERDDMIVKKRREEEQKISEFESELEDYRAQISIKLRDFTKKCLREIILGVNGMRDDLSVISDNTDSKASAMISSIDRFESEMKDEIRKILKEFGI